jgi:HEAT repeat protein
MLNIDPRSTDELIRLALDAPEEDDDSQKERWHFISLLQYRGDREVLDRSIMLTKSLILAERWLGIDILGQLGIPKRTFPDECLETLIGLLEQEFYPPILRDICIALGHLKDSRSIVPQLKFCLHPDGNVRYGVVSGLTGHHNDERAIAGLISLSADICPLIRDWATFGLKLTEADTPAIRAAFYQRFILEDSEDDETAEIYGEALIGLANLKDERIIPRLIQELMSDNVGMLAIEAAEALADDRLYPALLKLQTWWQPASDLEDALAVCAPKH